MIVRYARDIVVGFAHEGRWPRRSGTHAAKRFEEVALSATSGEDSHDRVVAKRRTARPERAR